MTPAKMKTACYSVSLLVIALVATTLTSCSDKAEGAPSRACTVVAELDHDATNFTQGIFIADGFFYESTGRRGESRLIRMDLKTGKVVKETKLHNSLFGEGAAVLGDFIYQLTWKAEKTIVFTRKNMRRRKHYKYKGEGWGLTTDGKELIMSNGTEKLSFRNADFVELRTITVTDGDETIRELNELEYIDGEIWANVWQQNRIARIDPATGKIKSWVDCEGLREKLGNKSDAGVLNGIAYDPESKNIWVTGKNWDKLFQIEVN